MNKTEKNALRRLMSKKPSLSPVAEIRKLHSDILSAARRSVENGIRIGELLTLEREQIDHGKWLPWLKSNIKFSDRTARNYIRLYTERDQIKLANVSNLSAAYALLAGPVAGDEPESPAEIVVLPAPTPAPPAPSGKGLMAEYFEAHPEMRSYSVPEPDEAPRVESADEKIKESYSLGLQYADFAIEQLKKIHPKDTERQESFERVIDFCFRSQGLVDPGYRRLRRSLRAASKKTKALMAEEFISCLADLGYTPMKRPEKKTPAAERTGDAITL